MPTFSSDVSGAKAQNKVRIEGNKCSSYKKDTVLLSYCHCNKLPQTSWLKITRIYYLIVLEVRSPKSVSLDQNRGVSGPAFLLATLGDVLFLCFFQLLEASCIPWLVAHHSSILCFHGHFSSLVLLSPSYKNTCDYIRPPR